MKKAIENVFVICYTASWTLFGVTITKDSDSVTFSFDGKMSYNKVKQRMDEYLANNYTGKPNNIAITSICDVTGKITC